MMRSPTTSRNVSISLVSNGWTDPITREPNRIRVQVFRFDLSNMLTGTTVIHHRPTEASLERLRRVLGLGILTKRPPNVQVTMGFGSVNHLSVEAWIDGRLEK